VTINRVWIGNRVYWTLTEHNYKQLQQSHWVKRSKDHYNYSTHDVFSVFTSRLLSSSFWKRTFPSSGFPNCLQPQLPASHFSQSQLSTQPTCQSNSKSSQDRSQSKRYVTTNDQSASLSLVSSTHLGPTIRFLLLSHSFRFVHVGHPFTRWVCRLQLLLVLNSAVILGSKSHGIHILLSQIRDSPNLEGQVPVFISPRNRAA
jgi:hypothetical protein